MLDAWLDLVAGSACVHCRRPGRLLCPDCHGLLPHRAVWTSPDPCPPGLAPAVAGGDYADLLRAMVLAHKERRAFALVRPLGEVLAVAARDLVTPDGQTLLVPVPSRAAVVTARGHDPMLRVTRQAAGILRRHGYDVRTNRLLRQTATVADQAGLDAADRRRRGRQRNLAGSMAETRTVALRALARAGEPVAAVVCDDVLTTGATAREAQRALAAGPGCPCAVACIAGKPMPAAGETVHVRRRHPPADHGAA